MDMVVLEHINIDWKYGSDPIYQLAFPTWWTRSSSSWLLQTWFKQWKNISGLKFGGQGLASSTIDQCNVTNSDIFSVPKSVPVGYSKYNGLHKSSNTRCQTLNHIAKKKDVQGFSHQIIHSKYAFSGKKSSSVSWIEYFPSYCNSTQLS